METTAQPLALDPDRKVTSEKGLLFWKRQPIYREGTDQIYLDRTIIIRCMFGSIMFHKIYLTDADCMHDHPWSFRTLILKGGYWEQTPCNYTQDGQKEKWYGAGSFLYRPADWIHRLRVKEDGKATWTLVFTSTKKRSWGFWTPRGWLPWRKYTNVGKCE